MNEYVVNIINTHTTGTGTAAPSTIFWECLCNKHINIVITNVQLDEETSKYMHCYSRL